MPTQSVIAPSEVSPSATLIGPRTVVGTTPPPGANWTQTVPAGFIWNVKSINATLTTDATPGIRIGPFEFVDDGMNIFFSRAPTQTQGPSTVRTYSYDSTEREAIVGTFIIGHYPIPDDIFLLPGYVFRSAIGPPFALAPGDTWTAPVFWIQEWAAND